MPTDASKSMEADLQDDARANPLYNESLAKGLQILESFSAERRGLSLAEVAEAGNMTKSSAQRAAFTLTSLGYLVRDPRTRRYQLTPKSMHVGYNYLRKSVFLEISSPHLFKLSKETGETVNLAERWGLDVIYIGRYHSATDLVSYMTVGSTIPVYCSSSGRAILSTLEGDEVRRVLESCTISRHTEKTIVDPVVIRESITAGARQGYCVTIEEYFPDDLSIAAPIRGPDNTALGAVNVSVPASRWTLEAAIEVIVPQLKRAAFSISSSMV